MFRKIAISAVSALVLSSGAAMAAGVDAAANSPRVARFTLTSVACAERITAIRSSKGDRNSSSVVGCGFAASNRLKISVRSSRFMSVIPRRLVGCQCGDREHCAVRRYLARARSEARR